MSFLDAAIGGIASSIFGGGGSSGGGQQQQQPQQSQTTPYDATPYNAPRSEQPKPWEQHYQPQTSPVGAAFGSPNPGQIMPLTGQMPAAYGQLNKPPAGMPTPPGGMPQAPKYAPSFGYEPQRYDGQAWGDKGSQQQNDQWNQYQSMSAGSPLGSLGMSVGHFLSTGRWSNPVTPFLHSSNQKYTQNMSTGGYTRSGRA